jgi:hypothetical protein
VETCPVAFLSVDPPGLPDAAGLLAAVSFCFLVALGFGLGDGFGFGLADAVGEGVGVSGTSEIGAGDRCAEINSMIVMATRLIVGRGQFLRLGFTVASIFR